jgi:hypothetical protein
VLLPFRLCGKTKDFEFFLKFCPSPAQEVRLFKG